MAIPKVCGIETEYGIHTTGGDGNPIAASSVLVNAYAAEADRRTGWDFEDETPGNDARGFAREGSMPPMVETHLANTVLTNGARYYVDHAHPEYSTPECVDPLQLVVHDKAGEEVLRRSMLAAGRMFPDSPAVVVYKNNSDGKGNSYGCHENYLMDRAVPFAKVVAGIVPHFVTRQIVVGAGKVGVETAALDPAEVKFQISQRAEFFEEVVGLETTLKRPIVNTRDEPHADPRRFRRLHVIVGDANLAEVATLLKVGTTAVVLAMIEDDATPVRDLSPADPVRAIHQVSADLSLARPIELADGSSATALDIQWELFTAARKYAEEEGLAVLGSDEVATMVLDRWESVLACPRDRPDDPGHATGLGGQAPDHAGLPGPPRLRLGRRPPRRLRSPVPRPAARALPLRPPGHGAADRRRRGRPQCHPTTPRDPGLVPGQLPGPLARGGRHRELGFPGVRPRYRSAPPRPYDGPPQGNGGPYGDAARREQQPGRVAGAPELVRG